MILLFYVVLFYRTIKSGPFSTCYRTSTPVGWAVCCHVY